VGLRQYDQLKIAAFAEAQSNEISLFTSDICFGYCIFLNPSDDIHVVRTRL
jgi:hypothetical protein